MTTPRSFSTAAGLLDPQQLEARLGARLAAALSSQSEQLAPDIGERLRFARGQALEHARAARAVAGPDSVLVGSHRGGAVMGGFRGFSGFWLRAMAFLPLVMLVAGLVAIDQWTAREQLVAVADVDAQLLADNLPPAAYSDPGFVAYLRSAPLQ
ncbi:MAG: DUF3619 family protein [Pseudomonadota bacterium]|nr:DUF3619 family protein [Pseudomonadota bacterium]